MEKESIKLLREYLSQEYVLEDLKKFIENKDTDKVYDFFEIKRTKQNEK